MLQVFYPWTKVLNKIIKKEKSTTNKKSVICLDEFATNTKNTNFVKIKKVIFIVNYVICLFFIIEMVTLVIHVIIASLKNFIKKLTSSRWSLRHYYYYYFNIERKRIQWVSKACTQANPKMDIHNSHINTASSFSFCYYLNYSFFYLLFLKLL